LNKIQINILAKINAYKTEIYFVYNCNYGVANLILCFRICSIINWSSQTFCFWGYVQIMLHTSERSVGWVKIKESSFWNWFKICGNVWI